MSEENKMLPSLGEASVEVTKKFMDAAASWVKDLNVNTDNPDLYAKLIHLFVHTCEFNLDKIIQVGTNEVSNK